MDGMFTLKRRRTMAATEKELDATAAAAGAALREAERLAGQAEQGQREAADWRKANEIDGALEERFYAALSPEDRKKAEDEQEAFNRELAHDLDAAIQRAGLAAGGHPAGGGKKPRSMA